MNNENGFTLIEMLIVLAIITMLLLLIIPNITSNSETIDEKGCDALIKTVQAQVVAYELETGSVPSDISDLTSGGYITTEQTKCKNGKELSISNGEVQAN